MLKKIFTDLSRISGLPETLLKLARLTRDLESTQEDLLALLASNPFYLTHLLKTDFLLARVKEWRAEDAKLGLSERILVERVVHLLGKSAVRNLINNIYFGKKLRQVQRLKKDRYEVKSKDMLVFAAMLEEYSQEKSLGQPHLMYWVGFHYDHLRWSLTALKAPKDVLSQFDTKAAEIKSLLDKNKKKGNALSQSDLILVSLAPLSAILASYFYPKEGAQEPGAAAYLPLVTELSKLKTNRELMTEYWISHRKKFVAHELELLGLYVFWVGIFKDLEPAFSFGFRPKEFSKIAPPIAKQAQVVREAK